MNTTTQQELQAALEAQGFEVLQGEGGFFLRGHGHVTTAKARKMTGLAAPERVYREKIVYGEYAEMVAFLNRSRS